MIFQPGVVVVFHPSLGLEFAFEVDTTEYYNKVVGRSCRLNGQCIDWDGKRFGRRKLEVDIPEFEGTKKIQTLKTFLLHFHENWKATKSSLEAQGKEIQTLCSRSEIL